MSADRAPHSGFIRGDDIPGTHPDRHQILSRVTLITVAHLGFGANAVAAILVVVTYLGITKKDLTEVTIAEDSPQIAVPTAAPIA